MKFISSDALKERVAKKPGSGEQREVVEQNIVVPRTKSSPKEDIEPESPDKTK